MEIKSELVIADTVVGEGKAAVKGALLFCHYTGYLEDGTKFDSSHDHGRPFEFVIGSKRVIQGWDPALWQNNYIQRIGRGRATVYVTKGLS